jgi:hypothetical protein
MGNPYTVGDRRIIPISRSYQLRLPAIHGGITWNRPVGVGIERQGEIEQVIPVHDSTRYAQIGVILSTLIIPSILWIIQRMSRNRE